MTKFTVPATTLRRFIKIIQSSTPDNFKHLKLEVSNGHIYLIGCNSYVACVQHLGITDQSSDSCYINITPELVNVVDGNINAGGTIEFETLPELAMGSVLTTVDNVGSDIIIWPDESPLDKWREWFITSDESDGFMYCNLLEVLTLWDCSPTGELVFPELLNANEPVIVRDINDDDWLGVFIPANSGKELLKPATLPEWL